MSLYLSDDERESIIEMINYFFPNDNVMSWSKTYAKDAKTFGKCIFCDEVIDCTGNIPLLTEHVRIHIVEWNKMKAFV